MFEYNGNFLDLLQLPYNLFQDLILKQIEFKKKELDQKQANEKKLKDWRTSYKPLPADIRMPGT